MSYEIKINGHHSDDNATVKEVAEDAVKKLRAAGHTNVTLTGYAYNGPERLDLTTPAEEEAPNA